MTDYHFFFFRSTSNYFLFRIFHCSFLVSWQDSEPHQAVGTKNTIQKLKMDSGQAAKFLEESKNENGLRRPQVEV